MAEYIVFDRVKKEKQARWPALIGLFPSLAGREERGEGHNLHSGGSCKGHTVSPDLAQLFRK